MAEAARQLVLDWPVPTSYADADFIVGRSNAVAFGALSRWPDWPSRLVLLSGPAGSGKTHLATMWARQSGAPVIPAAALDGADDVGASLDALVVENLHAGLPDESALFHLLNRARERRAFVLLTSERPPDRLALATPDLVSRLRLAPILNLDPPDDALMRAVFLKLFSDRQVTVDPSVVDYLLLRLERSFAAAAASVALLDREALSRGRAVTRPMAAEILSHPGLRASDED